MSNELMSLEEMQKSLAVVAKEENESEVVSTGRTLSIKGRRFTLGDDRLGEQLDVVVVATAFSNAYYKGAYDANNVQPPACFAAAEKEGDLAPHDTSPDAQSDSCASCPQNVWGSGTGNAKACKNGRRLVLLAYGKDGLAGDQIVTLNLPPTSIKNWASYAKAVTAKFSLPTSAVVTRLSFDPKSDWPVVVMDFVKAIDNVSELQQVIERKQEFLDVALKPYDVSKYDESKVIVSDKKRSKMS